MSKAASTTDCFMASEQTGAEALADFATANGEVRNASANRPIRMNDASVVWLVERGAVDVLAAEFDGDGMQSPFRHVMRLEPGHLAFGVAEDGHSLRLFAKGLEGTRLRVLSRDSLLTALAQPNCADSLLRELMAQTDCWIESLASSVARGMEGHPRIGFRLSSGNPVETGIVSADQGVKWVVADALDATFLDVVDAGTGVGMMPVTGDSWIRIHATEGLACMSTSDLGIDRLLTRALPEFHRLALSAESLNRRLLLVDEANLQVAQTSQRRRAKIRARASLATLTDRDPEHAGRETLLGKALGIIGKREGLEIRIPDATGRTEPDLHDFCEASGVRVRRVRLAAEDRWWLGDSGAMLAFRRADKQPVVLMPGLAGHYRIVDPATGGSTRADANSAHQLQDVCMLYPRLPGEGVAGLGDLFRVAGTMLAPDVSWLLIMGLGAGALALAPVVAINLLIGTVIPGGDAAGLFQLSALLTGLAFVSALFHVLRGTALMRLEGRLAARLGTVVWDRLLRLRPDFFRRYSAGELAARSMVFQDIRDHVSGVTADGVLSSLFLLPALGLLFFYDVSLGLAVACFCTLALAGTVISCILHIEPQRHHLAVSRQLAGNIHQFLSGISKLRTAGAEDSAFTVWAEQYREQKQAEVRLSALSEYLAAFSAAAPALASAILFAVVVWRGGGLETASFIAVHTAAMVFSMSMITLGNSVRAMALIAPACRQVEPILASPADAGSRHGGRRKLAGQILLDQVSFGYFQGGGDVLQDVTIHAKPGEFVAIVGESGAGKSTVFRLALGLETPSSGAVYYDGQDLVQLDLGAVRAQIGVVMQDGLLQQGNILQNITGVDDRLTVDDAWEAARMAAVEEDIRAMPMGMYTTVGENSATFSGGQSQRIRIAAALVHAPRILFLDEPTSSLDTGSQAKTMQCIENATCTRFVIAHRLSTIRRANRIYVLKHGRVAQTGNFDELLAVDGPFRDLALRQMT